MAAPSMQIEPAQRAAPSDRVQEIVESFASTGSYRETGRLLGIHNESIRDVIKSPAGSFALEQLLRERARSRALRLGNLTDRTIDEYSAILDRGEERVLTGRREDDPLTIWCRPGLRDVVNALAWATHHMREITETLSTIDVTNHDVSHESRAQNLHALRELVALEERRLNLDAIRALAPPSGALASPGDGDTVAESQGSSGADASSSSAADAVAALTHAADSSAPDTTAPSRTRPPTPATARETATETSRDIRSSQSSSSSEVTWDDLEEE